MGAHERCRFWGAQQDERLLSRSEVARVKKRYQSAAYNAGLKACQLLAPIVNAPFQIASWNNRAEQAYLNQWCVSPRHPDASWDWQEIARRHRDLDTFHLVIWGSEHRLCGLALFLVTKEAVEVRFLEGDHRASCPLKGRRSLIAIEAAACYAQEIGRTELWVEPVNASVRDLYVEGFGFEIAHSEKKPYFRRAV